VSAPSADRVAELAPMWESVSVHEAGHAVVGVLLDVPVHHVRLDYLQVGFLGRWEVDGYTGIGDTGVSAIVEEHVGVRFALAGLEAEALWLSTTGIPLARARAEVQTRHANLGDVQQINDCLPGSGITFDQALTWVDATLHDHWQTVTYLAETLRQDRYVTGADVARLI